ncbi:spinocerebellar ataxia type 10 protein domain-containing protein [Suillus clintonianus]|uniref:spinocerebellar ataxia type 10 protein domain-containing protein n=1 Tax=Suillus clintonianus TaxID=1904413 RepID=UPI001B875A2B|nr:spinocerebellar ataxia type 10 protein domain-containing protein [Suillus clintonianus]KAG2122107.1 spinocerebellar ataxia type 10 protein domain-containing protein [Suillus clintonianus]
MDSDQPSLNLRFCEICAGFLSQSSKDSVPSLTRALDTIASDLARNEDLRIRMGLDHPSIWPSLQQVWNYLADYPSADADVAELRILVISVARFTRNLVAGVAMNQQNAFGVEPALRRILHLYSSWSAFQVPDSFPATRMAVQALSNIVTTNEDLTSRLWNTYLSLPEEHVVLIRLLGSPDHRTILSLLVLMVNCIHDSTERRSLLTKTRVGARICITLLDRVVLLYDAEESSDGAKAFDYGYHLFAHLFDGGFAPDLYNSLSVEGEAIAPHQTTFLKLLDSYLQSSQICPIHRDMCPMLSEIFLSLASYSQSSITRAINPTNSEPLDGSIEHLQELDLLLPKTCEALVLATQCIVKISLLSEDQRAMEPSASDLGAIFRDATSTDGQGMAESIIELLRLLDAFLPRIYFGKAVVDPVTDQTTPLSTAGSNGFSYLKRDLVRLVGVLCHRDKTFQDRIRVCRGIPVIMNMCVVDERNPYLREHAILALRNLLDDNKENQDEVHSIKPSGYWDETGVLREKVGATLR